MKNILCIGGGNGMPTVLAALKNHPVNLTAVVTMADSGGSAGLLRKHYGTLPTGDVRRALAVLATTDSPLKELMTYRFKNGPLHEQSAGSVFLTSLEKVTGSFEKALDAAADLLKIKGQVLPVTLDNIHLCARLENGLEIFGEKNIDVPKHDINQKIEKIWLEPAAQINPRVETAIEKADLIIIGPGDLYTSLIPNLLVGGVSEAISQSKAKKVFIANLMTKPGETTGFRAEDFLKEIEKYVKIDTAVFNTKRPSAKLLEEYTKKQSYFVELPKKVSDTFLFADLLADGDLIRHDPGKKLADVILALPTPERVGTPTVASGFDSNV